MKLPLRDKHFGLWQVGDRPILIRVAEDELARLQRCPRPGVGSSPEPSMTGCDSLSRKPK